MRLYANTRMYNLSPEVERLWTALIDRVAVRSGLDLTVLDHPAPKPVEDLWARADLGLVMMCGWPFWRATPRPCDVAAPVLDAAEAENAPVYWTDMIVRADAPFERLEETFDGTFAWTVTGSHSGYNAPRHLLLPHFKARGGSLYKGIVEKVITPRGAIEAVLSGTADVAPLDGFFHLLLKQHEPDTAAKLRLIARTDFAPIPLFTASKGIDHAIVEKLRDTLIDLEQDTVGSDIMGALCIRRFTSITVQDYALGDLWEAEALAAGYPTPA